MKKYILTVISLIFSISTYAQQPIPSEFFGLETINHTLYRKLSPISEKMGFIAKLWIPLCTTANCQVTSLRMSRTMAENILVCVFLLLHQIFCILNQMRLEEQHSHLPMKTSQRNSHLTPSIMNCQAICPANIL